MNEIFAKSKIALILSLSLSLFFFLLSFFLLQRVQHECNVCFRADAISCLAVDEFSAPHHR